MTAGRKEGVPPAPSARMDEPLERLARFSFDWAESLCDPGHGCHHYHRTWSMVRLLEANGAMPAGGEFFGRGLAAVARDERCRILLSGAADTGLAAMILGQLRPAGIEPEFVLVDRCDTTLEQNRLFARAARFSMEVHRGDIGAFTSAPVQAVVAHSFLNFLDRGARREAVGSWARNLERGGRLLLSQRLLTEPDRPREPRSGEEISDRFAVIEQAAADRNLPTALVAELKKSLEALWREPLHEDRTTYADLLEMLSRSGLAILSTDVHRGGKNVSPLAPRDTVRANPKCEIAAVKI